VGIRTDEIFFLSEGTQRILQVSALYEYLFPPGKEIKEAQLIPLADNLELQNEMVI
jgi:hypothetical protein